jgi:hypothetical protein
VRRVAEHVAVRCKQGALRCAATRCTAQVRIARVGVVYGIAGVGNKFFRKNLREASE